MPVSPDQPTLLHRDGQHNILYKPAGLPVFPLHAAPDRPSLLKWWLAQPEYGADGGGSGGGPGGWPEGFDGGIAHRLDNGTSGLVVAAGSVERLAALRAEFSGRELRKFYRFRSSAAVRFDLRRVEAMIAHHPRDDRRMVVRAGKEAAHRGQWYPAWSEFRRIAGALWQVEIRTGVMHQIRAHAAVIGLALDGDRLYGGLAGTGAGAGAGGFVLAHMEIRGPGWGFVLPETLHAVDLDLHRHWHEGQQEQQPDQTGDPLRPR